MEEREREREREHIPPFLFSLGAGVSVGPFFFQNYRYHMGVLSPPPPPPGGFPRRDEGGGDGNPSSSSTLGDKAMKLEMLKPAK